MINITSNIDEVIERFKRKADQAGNVDVSPALVAGVNAARGAMTNRIFNKGLDNQGVSLGKYAGKKKKLSKAKDQFLFKKRKREFFTLDVESEFSEYELLRIKAGRQVRYKDEELTGTLKRGIVTIKENESRVVCAIPSNKLFLLAGYQEQQVGRIRQGSNPKIFSLSDQERQVLKDTTNEVLKQIYDGIINT
jgi:hypothetical protein